MRSMVEPVICLGCGGAVDDGSRRDPAAFAASSAHANPTNEDDSYGYVFEGIARPNAFPIVNPPSASSS
jgi:hypothetical protein